VSFAGPVGPTGPRNLPRIDLAQLANAIRSLRNRVLYLEKNRVPQPTQMHEVSNAFQMQQAQAGHAPVFDPTNDKPTGSFQPSPVLATMLFAMPGALTLATSDPMHARYDCNIVGFAADLTMFGSAFDVLVTVTGPHAATQTVNVSANPLGFVPVSAPMPLQAYQDQVTVETTSIGSGNAGLVFHVELAVDVINPPI
jgi:hypothetical protein